MQCLCGHFSGTEGMVDEFGKMFHMAMMYRGFTVCTSTWSRMHVHVARYVLLEIFFLFQWVHGKEKRWTQLMIQSVTSGSHRDADDNCALLG
jgi:hypothetical protein